MSPSIPRFLRPARVAFVLAAAAGVVFSATAESAPKRGKVRVPETPAPSTAEPAKPAGGTAKLRLWKFMDRTVSGEVRIRLLIGEAKSDAGTALLSNNSNHYEIGDYNQVPAGNAVVETMILPNGGRWLLPVYLAPGSENTVVVNVRSGGARAELADQRVAPNEDGKAFSVYNFLPGEKGDVQITLGDALNAHVLSPGGSLRLHEIKPALYPISGVGTDGEGKPFRWNGETDLRKARRATLIICPDAYGRIRPRLIEDGAEE